MILRVFYYACSNLQLVLCKFTLIKREFLLFLITKIDVKFHTNFCYQWCRNNKDWCGNNTIQLKLTIWNLIKTNDFDWICRFSFSSLTVDFILWNLYFDCLLIFKTFMEAQLQTTVVFNYKATLFKLSSEYLHSKEKARMMCYVVCVWFFGFL